MPDPFSSTELALLRVFRQKRARAGISIPTNVLAETVILSGGAPSLMGAIETALLNLQFRGLITPGPDPFSATSWELTESGDEVAHTLPWRRGYDTARPPRLCRQPFFVVGTADAAGAFGASAPMS